jgi:hypothetical protein
VKFTLPLQEGTSPWWTRTGYILGILTLSLGVFMSIQLSEAFGPSGLPHGLKQPMLAMELAENRADVKQTVRGLPGCTEFPCKQRTAEMQQQQSYDYLFICLYTSFFLYLGVLSFHFGDSALKAIALLLVIAVLAGAWFDWLEDGNILRALGSGSEPQMRFDAYWKWLLLTLAAGMTAPMFLFWKTRSLLLLVVRALIVVSSVATMLFGLWGFVARDDLRIEAAAQLLSGGLLLCTLFLAMERLWRNGTHGALDLLASMPILRAIARWPADDEAAVEMQ